MKNEFKLKPYTVFCREYSRVGTTWISTVWAKTPNSAAKRGTEQCASEWDFKKKDVECYCVIVGDVKVALFID